LAHTIALLVNFIGLTLSVWLGVYIVTHSRRSPVAWLSGLTLWVLADVFAHILLGIFSGPAPASQPLWLRFIFPIWPLETYKTGIVGWTQGWAVCLGVIFWYHTTTLILPGRMKRWRLASLVGVYVLGIMAMLLLAFTPYLFTVERADPFLIDTLRFGLLYPFFAFFLILFSGLSIFNLAQSARQSTSIILKKQVNILIVASLAATLATAVSTIGSIPGSSVPAILVSLPLLVAVCFFGYGVARYSALMEHRVLRRDIIYNGAGTGLVVLLYLGIFLWLEATYDIPDGVIVFLIPLVILSHSVVEEVRLVLDRLIYDRRTRDLRANLRRLSRLAGEQAGFDEMLSRTLETVCNPVRATYGVVLVIEDDVAEPAGAFRWHDGGIRLSPREFLAEDVCHLNPGSLSEPFIDATLLIPLYAAEDQIGAFVLGRPENGIHYSNEDVRFLLDPCDRIAELIIQTRRINDYLTHVVQMPVQPVDTSAALVPTECVEEVLQNFYDYAYLGDSPLVNLKQVQSRLACSPVTYLDRGKAVYEAVAEALEKLRPGGALPAEPIPRDWFPYLILRHAYVDGLSNRDIMMKLYISEGTFNRTRRSALRCVARVLNEIESNVN
jgi:hypothetical protein